jgi:putative holliday junction resolvase
MPQPSPASHAPPDPPSFSPSPRQQSFLAFDFGLKRVGVASGNTVLGAASPLRTISQLGDARFAAIEALVREWQPDALVVGVPFHPDGAAHENTRRAQRFARQLHGRLRLPVHEVDERYSTTEALSQGAADADAASAVIILEQYLRSLRAAEAPTAEAPTIPPGADDAAT